MSSYCSDEEQIVMTPTKRSQGHITITMERLKPKEMDRQSIMHVAGGDHTGIVITQGSSYGRCETAPPELFLGLKVMLKSMSNNRQQQENWMLKFWFKEEVSESERIENAQVFCTELVAFDGFPKDYVDFIKRTLKLMQLKYPSVQKVEVEMKKLDETKEKRKKEEFKVKKRTIEQNHDDSNKTDTMRARKKAEDVSEMQKIDDLSEVTKTDTMRARTRGDDLRAMRKAEELRARQEAEELRVRQEAEELRARQEAEELRARQEAEELRARQEAEELRAMQRAEELRAIQRAEELRARQEAEDLRAMQRAEELQAMQRAEELRARQEAEELLIRQRAEELQARQRAEELLARQRAEELQAQKRAEELQARQRAEELQARQRAEELQAQQRAEELQARQRAEELLAIQRAEELRAIQKAEEMREAHAREKKRREEEARNATKCEDWRETYKTDTMRAKKKADDFREKQKLNEMRDMQKLDDMEDSNKTDTMKAKKKAKASDSREIEKVGERREAYKMDAMKARQKVDDYRDYPHASETNGTKKYTYSDLSAIEKKLLEVLESVYPNSLSGSAIAKASDTPEDEEIYQQLADLETKGYLKILKNGNYMRISGSDADMKMVRQLPMVPPAKQPIIAIITAHFCEKVAVDTMIDDKETFVRLKTEGESNVYTLGKIGAHRVVSTKLPAMGHGRGQMIAAGSTTTRLLGSFSRVEYVFLVGVGGGVAHYTDYTKHVRLGDVVISTPPDAQRSYVYMYCEPQQNTSDSSEDLANCDQLSIKTWSPPSMQLQQITLNLWQQGLGNHKARIWERYLEQSLKQLQNRESSFCRPSPETDKLYMSLGENLIEVGHPQPAEGSFDPRTPGLPVLHFGAVGSGRVLMQDDTTRLEFADRHGILAFDTEFDSVVESIFGNRKDHYVFIRGIADYKDGTKKKEWQPYAALAAAAVMKAIICNLEPCD